ncbi:hypothetical protein SEA_MAGUCO_10 [Arthrobacter phage MaGuCo]|uniref:Uncharacterized protein n=1 Tax=Arthrobacter phage MaGuCo TaxID=3038363 RepID=A0AAF0JZQ6_9CAUD|nr:hypothetical protein SEA_MAGUCO_10 [Arthrobacter phage MaGuCo]
MGVKIRLDSRGIGEVLNSGPVRGAVESLGAQVAAAVGSPTASGTPVPVRRTSRTASGGRLRGVRPAVDITLAHPAGMAVEGKRGPLTRAARSVGLDVQGGGESGLVDYVTKSGKKRKATRAQVANWTRGR